MSGHNPKLRLGVSLSEKEFSPTIQNTPALPVIDWSAVGATAPTLPTTPAGGPPSADAVVITWADAEWAAMEHVFCASSTTMNYSKRTSGSWSGWQKWTQGLPSGAASSWTYWGEYRLVDLGTKRVLLLKSNTHLDWPGSQYLQQMIANLVSQVKPKLILSIGTAGGGYVADHIGTVRMVSAGTLYNEKQTQAQWAIYSNAWSAPGAMLTNASFAKLLMPIPTTKSDLQGIATQFNKFYDTSYSLADFDPQSLNMGDPSPTVGNQTGGAKSLLTTPTFVVGNTAGNYGTYACIEMDDAVIGEACKASGTAFGFVRNVSDPVQNAALEKTVGGHWGSAIYDAYGFYTSFNGALAAWAVLA
jgi:hypothetical protein